MSVNMNQSIFGLIAAAGSRVDFNERFDDGSSDDEGGHHPAHLHGRREDLSQTAILGPSPKDGGAKRGHKKRLSGHRLLKSFATLPTRKNKAKRESSRLSAPVGPTSDDQSESSDPSQAPAVTLAVDDDDDNRLAPVMSRMLQAQAELASRPSFDLERRSTEMSRTEDDDNDVTPLAKRLMEIFQFEEPERVIEGTWSPPLCFYPRLLAHMATQSILAGCCRAFCSRAFCTLPPSTFVSTPTFPRRL